MHRKWCVRPDRVHTWEISALSRPPDPVSAQEKSEQEGGNRGMNYVGECYRARMVESALQNRLNDVAGWAIIS